ncbi:MAG TPA: YifB family Mg chelatase-like AAA ATPase [Clostridiaceae bacterium]|nr:YifB family Mg chelatase-like AAA ATPase [Clostridiaceae bacterium]
MFSRVSTCGLIGLEGYHIQVESDISNGIPGFDIVGLADTSVKEARERVKAAINNSGYEFPIRRITVNLAPADTRKEGSGFDLPIALSILVSAGIIPQNAVEGYMLAGELALDGSIRHISGMLCKAIAAKEIGFKKIMVPESNYKEVSVIRGLEIYSVKTLREAVEHFKGTDPLEAKQYSELFISNQSIYNDDFSDVKGQKNAKRALEVAASGGHNLIMIGSPGSGKTMLARRLPTILPDLAFEESLEITKIYSVAGLLTQDSPLIRERPFRSPHHTVSSVSLVGGGSQPKPGEVSLAHHGVLFLDEIPEFPRRTLDVLRQPIEDGMANISRINATVTYPCRFMLVAAANPCKCGYYGDPTKKCTCSFKDAENYLSRLSGPLMDRIDIHIQVPTLKYTEIESGKPEETSEEIRKRVNQARKIQLERYRKYGIYCNAHLNGAMVREFCKISGEGKKVLRAAFDKLNLSARAHDRILKVSRTIADMEGSDIIQAKHVAEAIQYRALDRTVRV